MGEGSLAGLPQANVQVLSSAHPFLLGPHSLCKSLPPTIISDVSRCELSTYCVHSI